MRCWLHPSRPTERDVDLRSRECKQHGIVMDNGRRGSGGQHHNSKNRRKECKEWSALTRLKTDDTVGSSGSLDSLAAGRGSSPGSHDGSGRNRRTQKTHRQGRTSHRRSSVQSEVFTDDQAKPHAPGNRRGSNSNSRRVQRRLRRSASAAADRENAKSSSTKGRQPVRRTSSEGPRPRSLVVLRNGQEVRRGSSKRETGPHKTGSGSTLASADYGGAQCNNNLGRANGFGGSCRIVQTTSMTELFAVEVGLAPAPSVTHKESRRRRIVFAVVLVALALLTASVLLVAITLFLSPSVDEVLRKENENLFRFPTSTVATTTTTGVATTTTATTSFLENVTLSAAVG